MCISLSVAPGMHEATTAGSCNESSPSSGGDGAPPGIITTKELPYSYRILLTDGDPGNESRAARAAGRGAAVRKAPPVNPEDFRRGVGVSTLRRDFAADLLQV